MKQVQHAGGDGAGDVAGAGAGAQTTTTVSMFKLADGRGWVHDFCPDNPSRPMGVVTVSVEEASTAHKQLLEGVLGHVKKSCPDVNTLHLGAAFTADQLASLEQQHAAAAAGGAVGDGEGGSGGGGNPKTKTEARVVAKGRVVCPRESTLQHLSGDGMDEFVARFPGLEQIFSYHHQTRPVTPGSAATPVGDSGSSSSSSSSSRRVTKGDKVRLAEGALDRHDNGSRVLKPDDIGEVIEDDHSDQPYKVRCDRVSDSSWYHEDSLKRVVSAMTAAGHGAGAGAHALRPYSGGSVQCQRCDMHGPSTQTGQKVSFTKADQKQVADCEQAMKPKKGGFG